MQSFLHAFSSAIRVLMLFCSILLMLFCLIHLRSSPEPGLVRITLQPTADAYVSQENPTRNYGTDTSLIVYPRVRAIRRSLVKFDLGQIPPGSKLVTASLKLYVANTGYGTAKYPGGRGTYECYLLDRDWTENTVTWNNQPSSVSGTAVDSIVPAAGNWMTWDVTSSVSQFLALTRSNFGWGIRDKIEGTSSEMVPATYFSSRESKTNKPTLELSFYAPKLVLTGPSTINAGRPASLRVERKDYDNNPITRGDLRIQLSSSSASGKFSLSETGAQVSEVSIANGKSYVDFYYVDNEAGTVTISADTNQYRDEYYEGAVLQLKVQIPDTEGPIVKVTASPAEAKETDVISVTVEVRDPSGIERVTLYQSGIKLTGEPLESTPLMGYAGVPLLGTSYSFSASAGPFPGMKTVTFEVEAIDIYGNVGRGTATITILRSPPKLTCGCRETHKVTIEEITVYTHWDSIATGDLIGDNKKEVVVAQDDKGGRLYLYVFDIAAYQQEASGEGDATTPALQLISFDGEKFSEFPYTEYDRIAVGDVLGDEKDEIILIRDDDQKIYIYQVVPGVRAYKLSLVKEINLEQYGIKFTHFDALLVGNVFSDDEKDEIIIASDDDEKLHVLDNVAGSIVKYTFNAPSEGGFDEFRCTGKTDNEEDDDNGHDEIGVGDFIGDHGEEIVYADNNRDRLYIFAFKQSGGTWSIEIARQFHVEFTKYDAMCVGDVLGDQRPEVLIFRDEDRVALIYDPFLELVKMQYIFYSKWDAVTTGDLAGLGKDLILVAADDDDSIHISYSEEFAEG